MKVMGDWRTRRHFLGSHHVFGGLLSSALLVHMGETISVSNTLEL